MSGSSTDTKWRRNCQRKVAQIAERLRRGQPVHRDEIDKLKTWAKLAVTEKQKREE